MGRRLRFRWELGAILVTLVVTAPATAAPRPGFGWPLAGSPTVSRGFQPPASDYGAGHRGVDLLAEAGEQVLAAGSGWVSYAGLLAGRGVVAVTHSGGLRTTYEPVDAAVSYGDQVLVGEVLGTVATGHGSCSAGRSCLHWGLRRGEAYLDPLSLVAPVPVRLLPLEGTGPGGTAPMSSVVRVQSATGGRRSPGPTDGGPADLRARAAAASGAVAAVPLLLGYVLLTRRSKR